MCLLCDVRVQRSQPLQESCLQGCECSCTGVGVPGNQCCAVLPQQGLEQDTCWTLFSVSATSGQNTQGCATYRVLGSQISALPTCCLSHLGFLLGPVPQHASRASYNARDHILACCYPDQVQAVLYLSRQMSAGFAIL